MQPSPAERFHMEQQRWRAEQQAAEIQAAADHAAYVAAVQAAHHHHTEAMHLARGGSAVQYQEHKITVGPASTIAAGTAPHRVMVPVPCGTALGLVVGVESGPISFAFLWWRLVHTFGESGQWTAIMPIGQTQTSWRVAKRFELGVARYFGPFANEVAVELSPRSTNVMEAQQIAAEWEGSAVYFGVSAPA